MWDFLIISFSGLDERKIMSRGHAKVENYIQVLLIYILSLNNINVEYAIK